MQINEFTLTISKPHGNLTRFNKYINYLNHILKKRSTKLLLFLIVVGLDLTAAANMGEILAEHDDVARRCKIFRETIIAYQESMSAPEKVGVYPFLLYCLVYIYFIYIFFFLI